MMLVQAVEKWLPKCFETFSKESDTDLVHQPQLSIPIGSMLQYLANLFSAIQFFTNMIKCNDRRDTANEDDSPLMVRTQVTDTSYWHLLHLCLFSWFLLCSYFL